MRQEETLDYHIKWAWHKISKYYNQEAQKHNLTMSMGYVLLNIDSKNGTPATSLGPKMGMEPRSLSRILNTMQSNGLITRLPDAVDKRVIRVYLTEDGIKNREISKNTVLQLNTRIQQNFSREELNTFFKIMDTIKNKDLNEL